MGTRGPKNYDVATRPSCLCNYFSGQVVYGRLQRADIRWR